MGQAADEVRRDIERTRAEMGSTLDEIGDRVSPRRMVERRTARLRDGVRGVRDAVMGTAESTVQRASDAAHRSGEAVSGGVHAVGGGVVGGVTSARDGAVDLASSAAGTVRHAPELAKRQAAGNPLAAGLVAFGGGLLLATVLPKTRAEEQVASAVAPAIDTAKEQLRDVGQQVGEHVKDAATQAAGTIREQASEAATTVKERATEAGEHVAQEASAVAGEVRSEVSGAAGDVAQEASAAVDDVRSTAQR